MARIDLADLAHSYSGNDAPAESFALKPVTMTWRQGGAYALLGPSGCGKTTLLNLISGIVTPSQGKILFDGADITPLSTQKRNIAQVFQFPVIYDTMTVGQNLAFPLQNRGVPKTEVDARVKQIADLLDLTPYLGRKATRLTADAKQKISLGRGLVRSDVAAVLFDEPLTVIDPELKWQLRSKLKALHRELDLTMIYVTHDQTEALTFADTVVVMHDGRVVQSGTPAELFDKPAHTFVGYFIGSPGMNIVPAVVSGHEARIDGHVIGLHRNYGVLPSGAKIEVGVRPEFVNVAAPASGLLSAAIERIFLVVAFSAILPLMTVVNYSMQDTFGNNQFFWNGVGWFKELLDPSTDLGGRFLGSRGRNLLFSAIILAIEVPLGIVVALSMPREGWTVAVCLVILALPLLIPWNVVGTIWQIFGRPDIGLLGYTLNSLGFDYNYVSNEFDAWATVIVMDVWHWTSLVALLCYAGLKSIPDAYYQAAQIDGASRWAVFKAIQLPKMNRVLLIAVLLRFMDSFMIYTEPFVVTGGGPGNSTTFVSIELVKIALGQFDLGKAAALSLVYNLIILIVCWVFYTVMTNAGTERPAKQGGA
jgi:glycerol transport system ATP-binding protein